MLRSGTNDSNWVFPEEEDIHEVEQDKIIAPKLMLFIITVQPEFVVL